MRLALLMGRAERPRHDTAHAEQLDDEVDNIQTALEWQLIATILDRIFLIIFVVVNVVTSISLLLQRP